MTRVHHPHAQHAPRRAMLDHPRAVAKKKKPYKIVLEAVTQEKKKLSSILTYASDAPPGFGFIPAGNPEITEWCKEQCRQRNLDVHIVSAKPKNKMHADPKKLSHHVHRVGHHFPLEIINLACTKFGYTYDETNGLKKDKARDGTNWIAERVADYSMRQSLHGRPTSVKEDKESTRGAVREMFPKIPEADLTAIVNHAFEEGTNRVGNAKELPLARRVQLAVVAHIRHVYTEYDKILKTGSWMEARQKVEHVSLAKLKEWRDETGEQSNELEETFREVIVLDDDEDSSDDASLSTPDEREQSMEIVSSRATARDLQPERYFDAPHASHRTNGRVPRRTIVLQPYPTSRVESLPSSPQARPTQRPLVDHARTRLHETHVYSSLHHAPHPTYSRRPWQPLHPYPPPRKAEPILEEINGRLYHLEPIRDDRDLPQPQYVPPDRPAPRVAHAEYAPRPLRQDSTIQRPAHSRRASEQDLVIPSVEPEMIDLTSPEQKASDRPFNHDARPMPPVHSQLHSPERRALPSFDTEMRYESSLKCARPLHEEAVRAHRPTHMYHAASAQASSRRPTGDHFERQHAPSGTYLDLTSSPRRPPTQGYRSQYVQPVVGSRGPTYGPMYERRSPRRALREPRYDVAATEPSHSSVPGPGAIERPSGSYMFVGDEDRLREGGRRTRSGANYGHYDLH